MLREFLEEVCESFADFWTGFVPFLLGKLFGLLSLLGAIWLLGWAVGRVIKWTAGN